MAHQREGKASTTASTFKKVTTVSTDISASPGRIWELLTNAADFPRWNSTVTEISGTVAPGARLAIRVPISPRTFNVTVQTFDAARRLVWADGAAPMFRGVREFTLEPISDGTRFTMTETFSGVLLPLINKSLPDFDPVFTTYAADLKREAERSDSTPLR
ncbi:MAG: SRPBCC domain-containing protein [Gemmatimonadaceae bacterium]|nr:SRPBCC domain-containing protein [Gemmatimonadaceae bacterium]